MKKVSEQKINAIAVTAAVIAALAALLSAFAAYKSSSYVREINKPAMSLLDVAVKGNRVAEDRLEIQFMFLFKNIGNESLKVTEVSKGFYDFKSEKFEQVGESQSFVNTIPSESIFSQPVNVYIKILDPSIKDEELGDYLVELFRDRSRKMAIAFNIKYKGRSGASAEEMRDVYFVGYNGNTTISQIMDAEYEAMEPNLPDDFKL